MTKWVSVFASLGSAVKSVLEKKRSHEWNNWVENAVGEKKKKKKKEKKVKGLVCWLLDVTSHSLFTRGLFKQTNAALFCLNTKPKTNSNYYWPVDGIHYGWKRSNPSKMNLVFFFFRSGTESESSDINAKWNRVGWTGIKYAPKHKKKKLPR